MTNHFGRWTAWACVLAIGLFFLSLAIAGGAA